MAVPVETRDFVLDLFNDLPDVTIRAMMGGLAVYSRGRVFALVTHDERIYLKAAGPLARALEAEGATQFAYARGAGKIARMGYWTLPDAALDDTGLASDWAIRSLATSAPG